jgi:hypothetical protein
MTIHAKRCSDECCALFMLTLSLLILLKVTWQSVVLFNVVAPSRLKLIRSIDTKNYRVLHYKTFTALIIETSLSISILRNV